MKITTFLLALKEVLGFRRWVYYAWWEGWPWFQGLKEREAWKHLSQGFLTWMNLDGKKWVLISHHF